MYNFYQMFYAEQYSLISCAGSCEGKRHGFLSIGHAFISAVILWFDLLRNSFHVPVPKMFLFFEILKRRQRNW